MARPLRNFASFVGQRRVVGTLRQLVDGAHSTSRAVPHLLLVAAAGLGKTSLARALAQYAGGYGDEEEPRNFHLVQAGRGSLMQIHAVLTAAQGGDFVFIDEAHALGAPDAELLYLALDAGRMMVIDEQGRLDRTRFEALNPVTLVLATNQPGRLPKALETRLLSLFLEPYTVRELRVIAQRVASQAGVELTPQAARIIAQRAEGSPRRVERMLMGVDLLAPRGTKLSQTHIESHLTAFFGHDEHGLTPPQRRLLAMLDRAGALQAERILGALGLDPIYVRREIEGPLVARGLVAITGNHVRQITGEGRLMMALHVEPSDVAEDMEEDDADLQVSEEVE